jgi:uncharacterized protein YjbI with pentapeptide repeats
MTIRVFTQVEKQWLREQLFHAVDLAGVDLAAADLRGSRFEAVSLRGSDFRASDLRGVEFIDCDLRGACLSEAQLGANHFHGSCLAGAVGLSEEQAGYIRAHGGSFTDPGDSSPGG